MGLSRDEFKKRLDELVLKQKELLKENEQYYSNGILRDTNTWC